MILLRIVLVVLLVVSVESAYRRVCYYTNWSQYRQSAGKFFPENVDPNLCTHIIYSFAKLIGNKLHAYEWNDESTPWMNGMYDRFNKLKNTNPSLKTLLAVGGWNMASAPFTRMVATAFSRQEFAISTVKFLRDHNFDGLDLDWEYPANRGSPPGDKQKYGQLLETIKHEFESDARTSGKSRLLLSAATGAGKEKIDTGYDFPAMVKNLDMINLMSYDLHGSWETHTGHHSPLYKHAGETGNDTYLNIDWAASYYVKHGVPPEMINIGMALYGRSFTLKDPNVNDVGSPVRGAGRRGRYTHEKGFISYYEACEMLKNGGTRHYIADQMVPYVVKGSEWVGYDDQDSLRTKVKYVKQHHYGGVMVWALDLDDFSGSCGHGKYPLLNAIQDELSKSTGTVINPIVTQAPQPTTQAPQPTTQAPQPTTQAPQPTTQGPQPTTQGPQPTTQAPQPTTQGPQPTTQGPQPTTQAPRPTTQGPQPTTQAPQPTTKGPQPTTQAPQRTTKAPQHTSHIQQSSKAPVQTIVTHSPQRTTKAPTHQSHHIGLTTKFNCRGKTSGFYPNANMCDEYFICAGTLAFEARCASGLLFNTKTQYCDWPTNVQCSVHQPTQPQPQSSVTTQKPTNPPIQTNPSTKAITQPPIVTSAPVITQAPVVTNAPVVTQAPVKTNAPTQPPQGNNFCEGKPDGRYRDNHDCLEFYVCSFGLTFHEYCAPGTAFNEKIMTCDFPLNVPGC